MAERSTVYPPRTQPGVVTSFLREILATAGVRPGEKIVVQSPTRVQCSFEFDFFLWLATHRSNAKIVATDTDALAVTFDNGCRVQFQVPPPMTVVRA